MKGEYAKVIRLVEHLRDDVGRINRNIVDREMIDHIESAIVLIRATKIDIPPHEQDGQYFCTDCGSQIIKTDKYCHECGRPIFWMEG